MKIAAVILAAILVTGSLSACGSRAETNSEPVESTEVLVVDPNAGPGHTAESRTTEINTESGELTAAFVPRAAAEPVAAAVITEVPRPTAPPVSTPVPTQAPVSTPRPTATPTPTVTATPTPDHEHKWVTETIIDKAAYDEKILKKEAWDEETEKPALEEKVLHEAWDETKTSTGYTCNLCGTQTASIEEMEAHHQAVHADAADFGYQEYQIQNVIHHDAYTETIVHPAEVTIVHHEAEYDVIHHDEVSHTIQWCSICGVLKEEAETNTKTN